MYLLAPTLYASFGTTGGGLNVIWGIGSSSFNQIMNLFLVLLIERESLTAFSSSSSGFSASSAFSASAASASSSSSFPSWNLTFCINYLKFIRIGIVFYSSNKYFGNIIVFFDTKYFAPKSYAFKRVLFY